MKTIYVIRAQHGDYSDSVEWIVEAHEDKGLADARVERLKKSMTALAEERKQLWEGDEVYNTVKEDAICKKLKEIDPNCDIYYLPPTYSILPVNLILSEIQ